MKFFQRTPRGYDGTKVTTSKMTDLLPKVLSSLNAVFRERPDLILAAWPEIIGQKLASMTTAHSFQDGVLVVLVKNSTLHSLLSRHDKLRILNSLKLKFPNVHFKNVFFRIG